MSTMPLKIPWSHLDYPAIRDAKIGERTKTGALVPHFEMYGNALHVLTRRPQGDGLRVTVKILGDV